jgi:hypothetical protein
MRNVILRVIFLSWLFHLILISIAVSQCENDLLSDTISIVDCEMRKMNNDSTFITYHNGGFRNSILSFSGILAVSKDIDSPSLTDSIEFIEGDKIILWLDSACRYEINVIREYRNSVTLGFEYLKSDSVLLTVIGGKRVDKNDATTSNYAKVERQQMLLNTSLKKLSLEASRSRNIGGVLGLISGTAIIVVAATIDQDATDANKIRNILFGGGLIVDIASIWSLATLTRPERAYNKFTSLTDPYEKVKIGEKALRGLSQEGKNSRYLLGALSTIGGVIEILIPIKSSELSYSGGWPVMRESVNPISYIIAGLWFTSAIYSFTAKSSAEKELIQYEKDKSKNELSFYFGSDPIHNVKIGVMYNF